MSYYVMLPRPFESAQYTSIAFGTRCQQAGVRPSMGSVGDCFDNAMAESFFATLECELLERRSFKTQVEAHMAVFDFIEGWYNPHRRNSALGYQSPIDYERYYGDDANKILRCSAGAVQRVAAADPKPLSFPAPPSDRVKGGAEKLDSDQP
jgi:hypothetical protein